MVFLSATFKSPTSSFLNCLTFPRSEGVGAADLEILAADLSPTLSDSLGFLSSTPRELELEVRPPSGRRELCTGLDDSTAAGGETWAPTEEHEGV